MARVMRHCGMVAAAASMMIAGSAVGTANAGIAQPVGGTSIDIYVSGLDADTVSAGLTAEIFTVPGGVDVIGTLDCTSSEYPEGPIGYATRIDCGSLPAGDYVLGLAGVPAGYEIDASCWTSGGITEAIDEKGAQFTIVPDGSADCQLYVYDPSTFTLIASVNSFDESKLAGLAYDAYTSPGGVGSLANCVEEIGPSRQGVAVYAECDLAPGDYYLALDTVPTGLELIDSWCYAGGGLRQAIPGYATSFTKPVDAPITCNVELVDPTLLNVRISTNSSDPTILDGLTVEAFTDPGGTNALAPTDCAQYDAPELGRKRRPFGDEVFVECVLAPGDYQLGLDGVAETVTEISAECSGRIEFEVIDHPIFGTTDFTKTVDAPISCYIDLQTPPDILLDIVMTGDGPHPTDEPIIELYDGEGGLIGMFADPAEAECEPPELLFGDVARLTEVFVQPFPGSGVFTDCAVTAQAAGDYVIGLGDLPNGYVPDGPATCEPFEVFYDNEPLADGGGAFTHGPELQGPPTGTHCTIPLRYVEVTVTADVVVMNDDGDGASDGSDFIVEVFAADGGTVGALVDSKPDPAPNDDSQSAEFILPLGEYTFGISGPAGYETSVVVSVLVEATEAFPDGAGDFTALEGQQVSASIMADDIATTTTTTTIADDSGGVTPTLPPTGSSDTNVNLFVAALAMLLAGGLAVRLARRES